MNAQAAVSLPPVRGRVAFVFDAPNFDIDQIVGVENIKVTDMDTLVKVSMQQYDPQFAGKVRRGDVLVGGSNFGYGHPHYPPMRLMRHLGIAAVIADSFAPTYWSIELAAGFPQVACPGLHRKVDRGDELEIDWASGHVVNHSRHERHAFEPLSPRDREVLAMGGVVPYLKNLAAGAFEQA